MKNHTMAKKMQDHVGLLWVMPNLLRQLSQQTFQIRRQQKSQTILYCKIWTPLNLIVLEEVQNPCWSPDHYLQILHYHRIPMNHRPSKDYKLQCYRLIQDPDHHSHHHSSDFQHYIHHIQRHFLGQNKKNHHQDQNQRLRRLPLDLLSLLSLQLDQLLDRISFCIHKLQLFLDEDEFHC